MTLTIIGLGLMVAAVVAFLGLMLLGMAGKLDDWDEENKETRRS